MLDKVNLRASPSKDANAPYNIPLGTVMAYNNQQTVGGSLWYRVVYDNTQVWVLGSCVSVMTQAEYEEWLATQPTTTPQPEVVVRVCGDSYRRREPAYHSQWFQDHRPPGRGCGHAVQRRAYRAGAGYLWYPVKTTLGTGYVRGDCVEECTGQRRAHCQPQPPDPPAPVPPPAGSYL